MRGSSANRLRGLETMFDKPHVFSIGPHTLLARVRPGREHVGEEGVTRWDTVFLTEARKDPRDASPTGHHRGLMHFDIRVHAPHGDFVRQVLFSQAPHFPVNRSVFIPAIVRELHEILPRIYGNSKSGKPAELGNRIRSYVIRPDLSSENYPWIDLHPDDFEALVDHLQSRSSGAGSPFARKPNRVGSAASKKVKKAVPKKKKPKKKKLRLPARAKKRFIG